MILRDALDRALHRIVAREQNVPGGAALIVAIAQFALRSGIGVGGADLVGLLRPNGRFFGLEVKTEKGRLSPEQEAWARAVTAAGGFVRCVRPRTVVCHVANDRFSSATCKMPPGAPYRVLGPRHRATPAARLSRRIAG